MMNKIISQYYGPRSIFIHVVYSHKKYFRLKMKNANTQIPSKIVNTDKPKNTARMVFWVSGPDVPSIETTVTANTNNIHFFTSLEIIYKLQIFNQNWCSNTMHRILLGKSIKNISSKIHINVVFINVDFIQ